MIWKLAREPNSRVDGEGPCFYSKDVGFRCKSELVLRMTRPKASVRRKDNELTPGKTVTYTSDARGLAKESPPRLKVGKTLLPKPKSVKPHL